jgi:hypothetical protein
MLRDGQTKQPRTAALSLGDSALSDRKKENVAIPSQLTHQRRKPNQRSRAMCLEDAVRSSIFTAARKARFSTGLSMRARCRLRIPVHFGSSNVMIALHTSLVVLRKKVGADGLHCSPRASISSAKASAADPSLASNVTAKRRMSSSHSLTCLAPRSGASPASLSVHAVARYGS